MVMGADGLLMGSAFTTGMWKAKPLEAGVVETSWLIEIVFGSRNLEIEGRLQSYVFIGEEQVTEVKSAGSASPD